MTGHTLVLDPTYRPHRVVPWWRAMILLFENKIEIVETYDTDIHTVSLTFKMPAVVRLLGKVRSRKNAVKFSRINILTRDKAACRYCGKKLPMRKLNYDHVVPRSQGGKTEWTNIVTCCYPCNQVKGDRTPEQAGMYLIGGKPTRPTSLPITVFELPAGMKTPDCWATYLYWKGELDHAD